MTYFDPKAEYLREVFDPFEINEIEQLFANNRDKLKVCKVWKIENPLLERRFAEACRHLTDPSAPNIIHKFHGSKDCMAIVQHGFNLPSHGGMFGRAVYFASDASKSALYTSTGEMLMCKVALGKYRVLDKANNDLTGQQLKAQGFDSVFAKPRSTVIGGVERDEFVVYDPDLAIPEYLIKFEWNARNYNRLASLGVSLLTSYLILWTCRHFLYLVESPTNWLILFVVVAIKYFVEVVSLPQLVTSKGFLFLPILLLSASILGLGGVVVLQTAPKLETLKYLNEHSTDVYPSPTETNDRLYSYSWLCLQAEELQKPSKAPSQWSIGYTKSVVIENLCIAPVLYKNHTMCSPNLAVAIECNTIYELKSLKSGLLNTCYKVQHLQKNLPEKKYLTDVYSLDIQPHQYSAISASLGALYWCEDTTSQAQPKGQNDEDKEAASKECWSPCQDLPVILQLVHDKTWKDHEFKSLSWLPLAITYTYLITGLIFSIFAIVHTLAIYLYRKYLNHKMMTEFVRTSLQVERATTRLLHENAPALNTSADFTHLPREEDTSPPPVAASFQEGPGALASLQIQYN